VKFPIDRERNN